jgi:hypothetical protein
LNPCFQNESRSYYLWKTSKGAHKAHPIFSVCKNFIVKLVLNFQISKKKNKAKDFQILRARGDKKKVLIR